MEHPFGNAGIDVIDFDVMGLSPVMEGDDSEDDGSNTEPGAEADAQALGNFNGDSGREERNLKKKSAADTSIDVPQVHATTRPSPDNKAASLADQLTRLIKRYGWDYVYKMITDLKLVRVNAA